MSHLLSAELPRWLVFCQFLLAIVTRKNDGISRFTDWQRKQQQYKKVFKRGKKPAMVWKHWNRYSVFKQLRNLARPAGCIVTHLFLFTFYSLSKLQNNLTSVLNISIHRHCHHHLTISLSGYRARNISIAIMKRLFKALQLTQPEETGYCFNIILILSELLEPTRD